MSKKTFKEVLLSEVLIATQNHVIYNVAGQRCQLASNTVFISNIPSNALAVDIWGFFKRVCRVLDIVLPKRRDKNGVRLGFLKLRSKSEADAVIKNLNGKMFQGDNYNWILQN